MKHQTTIETMVDYSRFDNIDVSSDDEDAAAPHVTRFDGEHAVSFGGGQAPTAFPVQRPPEQQPSVHKTTDASATTSVSAATPSGGSAQAATPEESENSSWTRNGAASDDGVLLWTQDAQSVVLRVRAPAGTRAKDVSVEIAEQCVTVHVRERRIAVQLAYRVDASEDATAGAWELHDDRQPSQTRWVKIALQKQSPIAGAVFWWPRLRPGDDDVESLPDRNQAKQNAFAQAWNDAHEEFRKRRREEKERRDGDGDVVGK